MTKINQKKISMIILWTNWILQSEWWKFPWIHWKFRSKSNHERFMVKITTMLFMEPVKCQKIMIEFVHVTKNTLFSNKKQASIIKLKFIQDLQYEYYKFWKAEGIYTEENYILNHKEPIENMNFYLKVIQPFLLSKLLLYISKSQSSNSFKIYMSKKYQIKSNNNLKSVRKNLMFIGARFLI